MVEQITHISCPRGVYNMMGYIDIKADISYKFIIIDYVECSEGKGRVLGDK